MKYHVCTNNIGEAHQRQRGKINVHLICGNPKGDDVYSQSVLHFTCSKKGFFKCFCVFVKTFE